MSLFLLEILTVPSPLGYLPAEHIETPTERLARLNKHRNIDVSWDDIALDELLLTYYSSLLPCLETNPTRPAPLSGRP